MRHLNCLNLRLQAVNQTISFDLTGHIDGFENKIKLFIAELEVAVFPHIKKLLKSIRTQISEIFYQC